VTTANGKKKACKDRKLSGMYCPRI
jgi:hypothetical protein